MSPIPVREALRRLEAQGWVQFKPNAGAIVSPVDATSWEQAMVTLAILEGAATAEAQRHLRKSDFTRLRKIAAEMAGNERSQDDPFRFGQLNRRLHQAIVARSATTACLTSCSRPTTGWTGFAPPCSPTCPSARPKRRASTPG